jgi:hypothetical protein
MPARIKYNGAPLKVNGVPAGDISCCCDSLCLLCTLISALPDTIYITVNWCGTSTITLTKYYDYTSPGEFASCEKRWYGTGTFGGGGGSPAIFRVRVWGDCSDNSHGASYCFDGCTGGTQCDVNSDPNFWIEWADLTLDPLYGTWAGGAPPGMCGDGSCMTGYSLELSE